jgi:hypothetical protein
MINSASAQSDASQWQQLDFMAPVVAGLVSNVLNPGCHTKLGDRWNPTLKDGDDLGMVF